MIVRVRSARTHSLRSHTLAPLAHTRSARDFCNFQQHTYGAVLDVLLHRQDLDQALRVMGAQLQLLIDKKIAFDDLILSRKLAKEYKNENNAQNVVAKKVEQRTPGGGPLPGDRVEFVMVALAWSHEKRPHVQQSRGCQLRPQTRATARLEVLYRQLQEFDDDFIRTLQN